MRLLLILALVLVGMWLWRSNRRAGPPGLHAPEDQGTHKPIEMVSCAHCAVHIPSAQAVQGTHGSYCCTEHLHSAER